MVDGGLTGVTETLFWGALVAYAMAMVLLFASLTFRAPRTGSVGAAVAWLGFGVHFGSILTRAIASERVPWGNMFEYSNMIGFLVIGFYLIVVDQRMKLRAAGGFVLAFAVLALASARMQYVPPGPLQPALNSIWLKIHVIAAITGSALFTISFIFALLYLFKEHAERRGGSPFFGSTVGAAYVGEVTPLDGLPVDMAREETFRAETGFASRLPSADKLDRLTFSTIQLAFPIWTFAVIGGAIWAHEAWGRYWGWDPKEVWAFITWVIYAVTLHARATTGWRGRRAAILACVGYGTFLFNYFLVNTVFKGLHSYANG